MTRPHSTSSATGKLYLSLSAAWTSEREKCYLTVLASAVHFKLTTKMRRGCASVLRTNSYQATSGPKLPISSAQADFVLQIQGTSGREEKVKVPQTAQAQINPALPEPTIPHTSQKDKISSCMQLPWNAHARLVRPLYKKPRAASFSQSASKSHRARSSPVQTRERGPGDMKVQKQ